MLPFLIPSLLVSLLVFPNPAHAVIGSAVRSPGEHPALGSVCRLIMKDGEGNLTSMCSGSLIAPDRVLTAAHCFSHYEQAPTIQVQCGYEKSREEYRHVETLRSGRKLAYKQVRFAENDLGAREILIDNGASPEARPLDLAVVVLARQSRLPPIPVLTGAPAEACFLKERIVAAGFGFAENEFAGVLHSGAFGKEDLRWAETGPFNVATKFPVPNVSDEALARLGTEATNRRGVWDYALSFGKIAAHTTSGDSGGPLFCQDSDGHPRQIGVTAAGGIFLDRTEGTAIDVVVLNSYTPVNLNRLVPFADFVAAKGFDRR